MADGGGVDIVGLGEPLVVLLPDRPGPLRSVPRFERALAGAECNTLLGMARLGGRCGLVSRVSDDELGSFVLETLRAGQVDVTHVRRDPDRTTGLYFKEVSALGADAKPLYYRGGSAAAALGPDDVEREYIQGARVFITTGITALLSESAHEAAAQALRLARGAGARVVFDPNLRPRLWGTDRAAELLLPLLGEVDVYLGGEHETRALVGPQPSLRDLALAVQALGPREVVIKRGKDGAASLTDDAWAEQAPHRDWCRDSVGAGDAFNGGYLFARESGCESDVAMGVGSICASAVCSSPGDFETFPRMEDLRPLLDGDVARLLGGANG
ncbi:MAG: 2-dehydro-3-deoxygluconokinase [Thermoleophilaceae bacterium]|jgi:sugar/nucleoside kinase (ribokinase family)|nr:2-dehydro-3-deoxygluconokinase [Thermoleophilaceae bacterium]